MRCDVSVHAMHAAWCCLVCICMFCIHGRDVCVEYTLVWLDVAWCLWCAFACGAMRCSVE